MTWLLFEMVCSYSLIQYSFYVMESRVGLLRLKKDDNHKENTVGKIAKWRQIRKSTHAQIPILARFYSIM